MMDVQLKTLLLLDKRGSALNIPRDIRTLLLLELIISYKTINDSLIIAINTSRLNWIRYLVEEKKADVSYNDYYGFIMASKSGHLEVVRYLMEKGNPINHLNRSLGWASKNGHLEIVKFLIEQGANIHIYNALRCAFKGGHLEIVKYLVVEKKDNIHADNDYALRWASENGYLEMVKFLVEQGAHIHVDNDYALRWAFRNGHSEVVKYLVEQGANIRAYGYTITNI